MDNKESNPLDSQTGIMHLSADEAKKRCLVEIRNDIIKLLYLIEAEQRNEGNAELFLYTLLYNLDSVNTLCQYDLSKVIIRIHTLANNNLQYKKMPHAQIKRQIMESKGVLDHLIGDKPRQK